MNELLASPEFELLRAHGRVHEYQSGEYILYDGDKAHSLHLLISGSVAVMTEDEEGNELCANILGPGLFFGEMGLCEPDWNRSAAVRTRSRSLVLEVDYGEFLRLAGEHNQLLVRIIHQLSHKLFEMTTRARQFVHMSAPERVMYVLQDLSIQHGAESQAEGILVTVTKKELGNMAGCSRETASRALQELEASGRIAIQGRKVMVKSVNDAAR